MCLDNVCGKQRIVNQSLRWTSWVAKEILIGAENYSELLQNNPLSSDNDEMEKSFALHVLVTLRGNGASNLGYTSLKHVKGVAFCISSLYLSY